MNNFRGFDPSYTGNASQNQNPQQPRRQSGIHNGLGVLESRNMQSMNAALQQQPQSTGDGSASQVQKDDNGQNMTMQFGTGSESINESMQHAMMAFSPQHQNNSLSQFAFDPSIETGLNNNLAGQFNRQMAQMQAQSNVSGVTLSVDTQFSNMMEYNTLSAASGGYQPAYETDMNNNFMANAGNMPLDLSMMNEEDIAVMNDMFSAQQFGSPSFTSPMTATFGASIYGSSQDPGVGNMTTRGQVDMMQSPSHNPNFTGPSLQNAPETDYQKPPQTAADGGQQTPASNQSVLPPPPPPPPPTTTTTSSSSRKSKPQASEAEVVGGVAMPWTTPEGGWPSTMPNKKPHMETPYRDAYAPSGFDLMGTLLRVHTRPNPQIHIGAVDLSCAFVVCDAKAHDNPIIYCSESFERMTAYTKFEIKGQNCRFLQSPDGKVEAGLPRKYCDDESVLYLKNCVNTNKEAQISLINYRKGGQPFMNLLTMIPICDDNGECFQFVGFQVDLVENPLSISSRNPDGTYAMNYQRPSNLISYHLNPPDPATLMTNGQSIPRDEVSTILTTLGTSENDLSKRMIDKMILENSDDVIHVLSLKGLFLYLSPSCGKVLEYEPAELVGMALSAVCHPSDIVPVTRELKETQSGGSVTVVYRVRRKQSGYVWFESHGCLHTEQGKGRKCIILVGRTRPVYTLSKHIVSTAGGIGDHEMWSKMSTTGMFLYISDHVKGLLDKHADELVGTSIQAIMRPDSKDEFNRMLTIVLTGEKAELRHEVINRRGQVLQAHTWLYPGDASPGQKPTFVIAQTRLIKYNRTAVRPGPSLERQRTESSTGTVASGRGSQAVVSQGGATPHSTTSAALNEKYQPSTSVVISRAGTLATPLGEQNESLAAEENAFDELKTTRSSSWQYELRQLERRNRALVEEVQQLLAARKKRKRRRGAGMMQKDCANCHTTSTPEWRRGPSGNRDLCNSCGLRWAKQQGRVSPRTTSPRQSVSNDSNRADATVLQKTQENASQITASLSREESGNTSNSKASTAHTTATVASNPEKREPPEGVPSNPIATKIARTSISSLPHRIEEEDESSLSN